MKAEHVLYAALALLTLYVALKRFEQHPTYGRGVKAALAAVNVASLF